MSTTCLRTLPIAVAGESSQFGVNASHDRSSEDHQCLNQPIKLIFSTVLFPCAMSSSCSISIAERVSASLRRSEAVGISRIQSGKPEAIIGMRRFSYLDDTRAQGCFASGLGAHFHLLSSQHGVPSVGGRFNIAGTAIVSNPTLQVS